MSEQQLGLALFFGSLLVIAIGYMFFTSHLWKMHIWGKFICSRMGHMEPISCKVHGRYCPRCGILKTEVSIGGEQ